MASLSNSVTENTVVFHNSSLSGISENADLKEIALRTEKLAKDSLSPLVKWMTETVPAIDSLSSVEAGETSYPVERSTLKDLENPTGGDNKFGIEMYAPAKTTAGKTPILIFSHGAGVGPAGYRPLLEKIASQGYVVLCLNHPSSSGLDSDTINRLENSDFENLALIQANNIRYVIDQLQNENGPLIEVRKIGLTDQIVLAGHSLGGAASVMVSQSNQANISGCINLDGELKGTKKMEGVEKPVLTIFADHLNDQDMPEEERPLFEDWKATEYSRMLEGWKTFHEKSSRPHIGKISGITHMDFVSDSISPNASQLKAHRIASETMLKFMKNSVFFNSNPRQMTQRCCCIL